MSYLQPKLLMNMHDMTYLRNTHGYVWQYSFVLISFIYLYVSKVTDELLMSMNE